MSLESKGFRYDYFLSEIGARRNEPNQLRSSRRVITRVQTQQMGRQEFGFRNDSRRVTVDRDERKQFFKSQHKSRGIIIFGQIFPWFELFLDPLDYLDGIAFRVSDERDSNV